MDFKEISPIWMLWFKHMNKMSPLSRELYEINKKIEMEKIYPILSEERLKEFIRRKILLQCKIGLLKGKEHIMQY